MDYRYFPEPDLLPIVVSAEMVEELKIDIPELPIEKRIRYLEKFKL
jgi:aspartyl-tRNA(Asn)/glutamyl-tRNA(Gln) amidotransferase subunit B